jgi:hypothetical protein
MTKNPIAAVVTNASLIILYTVLTSLVFEPWFIGFTIGLWVGIVEMTFLIFLKYYQTYYQVMI